MNPQWIGAALVGLGLAAQLVWTLVNLRIENRILLRLDELKEWCEERFVLRPGAPVLAISRRFRRSGAQI
jgi:hypothetical protein